MDLQTITQADSRTSKLAKIGAALCFVAASAFLMLSHSTARARTDAGTAGNGYQLHFAR
ncbi:MAG: hypothetical protein R3D68_01310 [Hyphomicrobiaceae bacterium]